MKQSVYIESTVISYLAGKPSRDLIVAAHQQLTRDWWDIALPKFDVFISQFVINEISEGDPEASKARLKATSLFSILQMNAEIADLANRYFKAIHIPDKARTDAYHLAMATWHGVDYMVSWNCKHIASARVRSIVDHVNADVDYATPIICTPEELMEV
jgi:hypothetical protein